eukprot:jgi/Galph1/5740/GphlegSOOS_G4311.1
MQQGLSRWVIRFRLSYGRKSIHQSVSYNCEKSIRDDNDVQATQDGPEKEPWFYNRGWPYEPLYGPRPKYPKRKSPVKRAISLMKVVETDEMRRMVETNKAMLAKNIPDLAVGDVARLKLVDPANEENIQWFTGKVIHIRKAYTGSMVTLRNAVKEVGVERVVPLYSPWVREAVLLERHPTEEKDLLYLRERPLKESYCGPMEPPDWKPTKKTL